MKEWGCQATTAIFLHTVYRDTSFLFRKMGGHVASVEIVNESKTTIIPYLSYVRNALLREIFYKISFSFNV